MFNQSSPTVHNILYGQQNSGGMPQSIPPNYVPQNNMMNVGSNGYNQVPNLQQQIFEQKYGQNQQYPTQGFNPQQSYAGGIGGTYYNNNLYQGYYNPYLYQQQMEYQRIQMQEQLNQESSIMKRLSKAVNTALGEEVDEKYLSQYDVQLNNNMYPTNLTQEQYENYSEAQINERLTNSQFLYTNPRLETFYQVDENISKEFNQNIPSDISMADFFSGGASLLYERAVMRDLIVSDKDVTRIYDKGLYGKLLKKSMSSMGTYGSALRSPYGGQFSSFMSGTDISDMEIKLPDRINNEYQARKQEFMNSLLKRC